MIGIPMEPNATGAVFASRQMPRGIERREAETGEHGGGDRDRCSETRRAFDERAECERDQQRLQTPVVRQVSDRILDDFELAGFYGDVVKQYRGENDPTDGKQTLRRAVM